jgi:hypothetical protein
VRTLAGRSAEAAKEIKQLIQASVASSEAGAAKVGQAGQTMGRAAGLPGVDTVVASSAGTSPGGLAAGAVSVIRISAYQAQFRPSDSSCSRSRLPMSMRDECTPSSFHGSGPSTSGARITTGAPLVPRCVRASVRKKP